VNKNIHRIIIYFFLILFLIFSLPQAYGKNSLLKNLNSPTIIEPMDLVNLVNHPLVRIVDPRSSLSDYLKAHIPNAVYLNFESLRVPEKGIPAQAPDRIYLERLLGENLCLFNNMWIILYSEKSNINATILSWSLDFLGYKKFALLNGGWEKWWCEKFPATQEFPSISSKKFFGKVIQETLAEKKYVLNRLNAKNVVIIDARSPKQYSGEYGEEIRKGHIPGAINIFWEKTLNGEEIKVWKNKDDLERLFYGFGVTRDKEIIVYSGTGKEASHLYFTLKHILQYPNVRLYRGSWIEWSSDPNLPVKLGYD